jgi:DNA-binding PadR family transcriptional regulator
MTAKKVNLRQKSLVLQTLSALRSLHGLRHRAPHRQPAARYYAITRRGAKQLAANVRRWERPLDVRGRGFGQTGEDAG